MNVNTGKVQLILRVLALICLTIAALSLASIGVHGADAALLTVTGLALWCAGEL